MHYFGIPKPTVSMKSKEYDSVKVVLGIRSKIALWECFFEQVGPIKLTQVRCQSVKSNS